jgi:hypothetical protein
MLPVSPVLPVVRFSLKTDNVYYLKPTARRSPFFTVNSL